MRILVMFVTLWTASCCGGTTDTDLLGDGGAGGSRINAGTTSSGTATSGASTGPAQATCLPPSGPVATSQIDGCTCLDVGTKCGLVTYSAHCEMTPEQCGCGNGDLACVDGNCACTEATGAAACAACAACPGAVARYCGEANPKTQPDCVPSGVSIGTKRVWCCGS